MRRRTLLRFTLAAVGASALHPIGSAAAVPSHPSPFRRHVPLKFNRAMPLHPRLQYGAVAEPGKRVSVIVQGRAGYNPRAVASSINEGVRAQYSVVLSHVMTVAQRDLPKLAAQPGVVYISPDSRVHHLATKDDNSTLQTRYPIETDTSAVWVGDTGDQGAGVTVAVLDTGVADHPDLQGVERVNATGNGSMDDGHGHGTHVAGIIVGNNPKSGYVGIAPAARLVGVRVADDTGNVWGSDLLQGLEWVYRNHEGKKIRALNLSLSMGTAESYFTSPMAAAVERLWSAGIVVVAAAGNLGNSAQATWYAPGNDPYVITVGALDDNQTLTPADDVLTSFSSYGATQDGFAKPDIVAPGRKIVSTLASPTCVLAQRFPDRITDTRYIRLSGTSTAAPMVTGVVALLLSRYPNLSPNQVKAILTSSSNAYAGMPDHARSVDALAALALAQSGKYGSANQGLTLSAGSGSGVSTANGSDGYWDDGYWDDGYWDDGYWDDGYWDDGYWD